MDIVKYDWRLSGGQPFVYDWQQYGRDFHFPGYDMHGDLHLLIMLRGSFTTGIGKRRFSFLGGDLILIAPWEVHGNYTVSAATELLSVTVFHSSLRNGLSAAAPRLDALLRLPPEERMKRLHNPACAAVAARHAQTLIRERRSVAVAEAERIEINDFSFSSMESALEFIRIQKLFAELLQQAEDLEPAVGKRDPAEHLAPALQLLESGAALPLTTARAARRCNLSRGYFDILFKKIYGISFYAYELQYRLKRAEADLRGGRYSIKEIAQRQGFADASHFSRTFKKYYALAPSNYPPRRNA